MFGFHCCLRTFLSSSGYLLPVNAGEVHWRHAWNVAKTLSAMSKHAQTLHLEPGMRRFRAVIEGRK